ncbi:hypothetical protein EPO15_13820 [bacterium]|nr:MAG: hypothetical protein EPO15_13820 [bacterium]
MTSKAGATAGAARPARPHRRRWRPGRPHRRAPAGRRTRPRAGGGAGAGAGDGAGPGEGDAAGNPQDLLTTINTLMEKASKKRDEQADNEKKAAVLAALGQHPQALYHYDKAKKAEKKAKQYEKEAQQLTVEAAALSGAQTTPAPQPAP